MSMPTTSFATVYQHIAAFITTLRDTEQSKGVHVVYSGLNNYLQETFGLDKDARIALYQRAEAEKIFACIPARGGAMVYLWADKPSDRLSPAAQAARRKADAESKGKAIAGALRKLQGK